MDISENIKNDLMICQQKLRGAIGLHQKIYQKLKANPKDKRELTEKLANAQNLIKSIAKQQKPLIQELRDDLDRYHEKLKREKKQVNYDADTAYIEQQLEDYQNERNKYKSLLQSRSSSPTSVRSADDAPPNEKSASRQVPTKRPSASSKEEKVREPPAKQRKMKAKDEKPKSKFLQDRRSKLLSVLNKVCKQNTPATSSAIMSSPEETFDATPTKSYLMTESLSPGSLEQHDPSEEMKEEPQELKVSSHSATPSPLPEYELNRSEANNKHGNHKSADLIIVRYENDNPDNNVDPQKDNVNNENYEDDNHVSDDDNDNTEIYENEENLDDNDDQDANDIDMNVKLGSNDEIVENDESGEDDEIVENEEMETKDETNENEIEDNDKIAENENSDEVRDENGYEEHADDENVSNEADSSGKEIKLKSDEIEIMGNNNELNESENMETLEDIEEDFELSASLMKPGSKEEFFR